MDEDTFEFPDAWRRHLHPRRGGAAGAGVKRDAKAVAGTDALVAEARTRWLDKALSSVANDVTVVEETRRALDGEASVIGAAVLALAAVPQYDGKLGPFGDAWISRHGVAFAALAAVKFGDVFAWPDETVQLSLKGGGHRTDAATGLLRRMRTVLAGCSDADYAETVAALNDARTCCQSCAAASAYLVPTETAWVAECCRDYHFHRREGDPRRLSLLLCALSTNEQLGLLGECAAVDPYDSQTDVWVTMVDGLGPTTVAPLFRQCFGSHATAEVVRAAGSLLAQFPGDEAFGLLAARHDHPNLRAAFREASERFPVRALRILSSTNSETLRRHVLTHQDLARETAAELPEPNRTYVLEILQQNPVMAAAPDAALPTLLVSPPWAREAEQAEVHAAPKVVTGLKAPALTQTVWGEAELAELAHIDALNNPKWNYTRMGADVARWIESGRFDYNGHNVAANFFGSGPIEESRALLRKWRPDIDWNITYTFWPILRRFDVDAIPALTHVARKAGPIQADGLLLPVLDLEAARVATHWLANLKTGRDAAEAWFARHGANAALLLIPDAVGKPSKARNAAEVALRHLAATTVPELVDVAAAQYGAETAEAVRAVLDVSPADLAPPITPPTLPDWLDPTVLPQVLLSDREHALSPDATRHFLSALALPSAELPDVLKALDRTSVAEFGWQVFAAWRSVGYPSKQAWILPVQGVLGDDSTADRLTPLIMAWPGESAHHRAVTGVNALAAVGTDHALMRLTEIAQRTKFKALKLEAGKKIAEVAALRGLTAEQLADRLVPGLGLDADGGLWLDYGPRRFRACFDEQLKPFITDEAGKRRKDLPPSNSKDDAALATAARAEFAELKKLARTVASYQIRRLEAALVDQRSWTAAEFTGLLVAHPLLRHVVRRLLWVSEVDGSRTGFRVAEDLSLADIDDNEFSLPADATATVRLAHPLTWSEGLAAWAGIFADYEILQPFPQLARETFALTDEEKSGHRLARFEGKTVPIGKILGLTKDGWQRSPAMDAGVENCITKELAPGQFLVIDLDGGIPVGYVTAEWAAEQTLKAVYLSDKAEVFHAGRQDSALRLADVDPLSASETLAQLTRLVN
ncbi:MAG TPA: DUF4132 domain-containing protein [Actinospica sp.]|nr:DUF4132 domain-containing protein [Actinospica sp.]